MLRTGHGRRQSPGLPLTEHVCCGRVNLRPYAIRHGVASEMFTGGAELAAVAARFEYSYVVAIGDIGSRYGRQPGPGRRTRARPGRSG